MSSCACKWVLVNSHSSLRCRSIISLHCLVWSTTTCLTLASFRTSLSLKQWKSYSWKKNKISCFLRKSWLPWEELSFLNSKKSLILRNIFVKIHATSTLPFIKMLSYFPFDLTSFSMAEHWDFWTLFRSFCCFLRIPSSSFWCFLVIFTKAFSDFRVSAVIGSNFNSSMGKKAQLRTEQLFERFIYLFLGAFSSEFPECCLVCLAIR